MHLKQRTDVKIKRLIYQRNRKGFALFYEQRLFHQLQFKSSVAFEICRPIVNVCDVTLLCIIAMSVKNWDAG